LDKLSKKCRYTIRIPNNKYLGSKGEISDWKRFAEIGLLRWFCTKKEKETKPFSYFRGCWQSPSQSGINWFTNSGKSNNYLPFFLFNGIIS
jgi:hypothetical protein